MASKKRGFGCGGQLLLLAGLLGFMAIMLIRALDPPLPLDAPTVPGEVISYSGGRHPRVTVAYTLPDGRQLRSTTGVYPRDDEVVGRQVTVRYNPKHPKDIAIDQAQESRLVQWIAVGLLGLAAVIVVLIAVRRA